MRRILQLLLAVTCLGTSVPAAAQLIATDEQAGLIMMTTTTSSAVAVGVVMLTVVNARRDPSVLRQYLRQNEPAVRAALAFGGGEAATDLAGLFAAGAEEAAFARMLRRHGGALAAVAYVERDARRFSELVEMAMQMDPALREYVAR